MATKRFKFTRDGSLSCADGWNGRCLVDARVCVGVAKAPAGTGARVTLAGIPESEEGYVRGLVHSVMGAHLKGLSVAVRLETANGDSLSYTQFVGPLSEALREAKPHSKA